MACCDCSLLFLLRECFVSTVVLKGSCSLSLFDWEMVHKYLLMWSTHKRQEVPYVVWHFSCISPQANSVSCHSAAGARAPVRDMQHGRVAQAQVGNEKSFSFCDRVPVHCSFWYREDSQKLQHFASCKTGESCVTGRVVNSC